jgi:biopolymer transport protein ExbD
MRIEPLDRPHRSLRLAPLVDVVFLLLVFFMLVARLETPRTIAIEPPFEAGGGSVKGAVLIRLGPRGELDFNGQAIDVERLPAEISLFLARDFQQRILVQTASSAPLQALVQILDLLNAAGAEHVTLVEP